MEASRWVSILRLRAGMTDQGRPGVIGIEQRGLPRDAPQMPAYHS